MKAIILNILFIIAWAIIGHYFPSITLFTTFFVYPIFIFFSAQYLEDNFIRFLFIPFCFLTLLINDYLFRIYGGGIHDDAGRGWCELNFYITLSTSTIALLFIAYNVAKQNKLVVKLHWFYSSLLVVCSVLVTYFVFIKFSVKI